MAGTAITFNSYDLNSFNGNFGTWPVDIDDGTPQEKDVIFHRLLRTGGAVVADTNYYERTISVRGKIQGNAANPLESLIDTFQSNMYGKNQNLDIAWNGSTRRYVSTPTKHIIKRPVRAANWAEYQIDFLVTEYGKDTSATSLASAVSVTTTPKTQALTIGGSAPEQFVNITLVVTAATGLTAKTVTIQNQTTGQTITILRTWTVGDSIAIDSFTRTVTVNGSVVDYSGAFPIFTPGNHNLVITNNFTTFTLTLTVTQTKRYL
jgi:phage-related protein